MRVNRKIIAGSLVLLTGVGLAGCQKPAGKWSLASVEPTALQRDVEFHNLTLQEDGTFYAEAMEGGRIQSVSGTYAYDNGVLILTAHDGETHAYDARIRGANKMYLASFEDGRKVKMKYERRERTRAVGND